MYYFSTLEHISDPDILVKIELARGFKQLNKYLPNIKLQLSAVIQGFGSQEHLSVASISLAVKSSSRNICNVY